MLIDELKKRLRVAMKERDEMAKNVLSVALGEIQTAEARNNRAMEDEEAVAVVRKLVKANEETIAAAPDGTQAPTLRRENALLGEFLPKMLSIAQIVEMLASERDAIRGCKSDGQAMGIAMKFMKTTGAAFEGSDVTAAVKQIRI